MLAVLHLLVITSAAIPTQTFDPPAKTEAAPAVRITVDTSEVPELDPWALKAKALCEKWYPVISDLLESDGYTPPSRVELRFKKEMRGVAYTIGSRITISGDYVKKHPDDLGMVVHELTHVVQGYRPGNPSWLVEGVADYVRHSHFEPNARMPRINPRTASYKDSYKTAATFLAWLEKTYDKQIVNKLNRAMRERTYKQQLFRDYTGEDLDDLWKEFALSLEKKR